MSAEVYLGERVRCAVPRVLCFGAYEGLQYGAHYVVRAFRELPSGTMFVQFIGLEREYPFTEHVFVRAPMGIA